MPSIESYNPDALPPFESEVLEYRSSKLPERELLRRIQNAASAFWNSGGGVFFAGVDNQGKVNGGIPSAVGRQSCKEWVDQALAEIKPPGTYKLRLIEPRECKDIGNGKCVLAIEFAPSSSGPHQSTDKCYYIRAGAQTVPAPHDLVEALFAKKILSSWTREDGVMGRFLALLNDSKPGKGPK